MKVLMVGAGAIGGYFGARLAQVGREVTFLVRPQRAALLRANGLVVKSPLGDATIVSPSLVVASELREAFDLIVLTCKAYDLDAVINDIAPAVGPNTAILPLLNGMAHLDALDARFGAAHVLGGQCVIAVTLAPDGSIHHLNEMQSIGYGERDGSSSVRIAAIAQIFEGTKTNATASSHILADMWDKWVFLCSLAASTCLMRAPTGAIVAAQGGTDFVLGMIEECRSIAESEGFAPKPAVAQRFQTMLTQQGSFLTASMMRDMTKGGPIEADHIIGDLLRRGKQRAPAVEFPKLSMAYLATKAYENARQKA
jgi:2-dehydropantoate 2-reductase